MEKIRTFIAIEIPEDIKKKIATLIDGLKERLPDVSWVKPSTLHITLKFLGSVEKERIEPIERTLEKIGSETSPFELVIADVGGFPSLRAPRVLWIGVRHSPELSLLYERVEKGLEGHGFEPEHRPFKPHLTLCRIKKEAQRAKLSRELERIKPAICESFVADGIILFKSELNPRGAIHTPLKYIGFKH